MLQSTRWAVALPGDFGVEAGEQGYPPAGSEFRAGSFSDKWSMDRQLVDSWWTAGGQLVDNCRRAVEQLVSDKMAYQ